MKSELIFWVITLIGLGYAFSPDTFKPGKLLRTLVAKVKKLFVRHTPPPPRYVRVYGRKMTEAEREEYRKWCKYLREESKRLYIKINS